MEQRQGHLDRARELFQAGVWAEPGATTVTTVWQAWAVLEAGAGNDSLARQLFKCAVKADPSSAPSWQVRGRASAGAGAGVCGQMHVTLFMFSMFHLFL